MKLNQDNRKIYHFESSFQAWWWVYIFTSTILPLIILISTLPQTINRTESGFPLVLYIFLGILAIQGISEIKKLGSITIFDETISIKPFLNLHEFSSAYQDIDDIKYYDVIMRLWGLIRIGKIRMVEITLNSHRKYQFASKRNLDLEELVEILNNKYKRIIKSLIDVDSLKIKSYDFGLNLKLKDEKLMMGSAVLPIKYSSTEVSSGGTISILYNKKNGEAPKVWLRLDPNVFNKTMLLKYIIDEVVPERYR